MRTWPFFTFARSSTRGHEPLCSRSRCVVIRVSFVSFVSAVDDTTCADADTSRRSSGVRLETARRTSGIYSSNTISSHRCWRVFAVVRPVDASTERRPPSRLRSRSRSRDEGRARSHRHLSVVNLARASSVHYGLNARITVIARVRRVLSTASSFCARATRRNLSRWENRGVRFRTTRESRNETNRRARTKNRGTRVSDSRW